MTVEALASGIRELSVGDDAVGFPVVRWREHRGSGLGAAGLIHVECRIMKQASTGVLMFVARGPVQHGTFEEGQPWEALKGFSMQRAEELYYSSGEASRRRHLASKGLAARWLWGDPGRVLVAEFSNGRTIHLNHVDTSQVDLERLHRVLEEQFIWRSEQLVGRLCKRSYWWPPTDDRVKTYISDSAMADSMHVANVMQLMGLICTNTLFAMLTSALAMLLAYLSFELFRPVFGF